MLALRVLILITLIVNMILVLTGCILNVNIYKKYGKEILKWFVHFAFLVLAVYVAMIIIGLN